VTRLAFAALSALPSAAAHSQAIAKSCEAYAAQGLEVELWHLPSREAAGASVAAYHGVTTTFRERPYRPRWARRPLLAARMIAARSRADAYVTRQLPLALGLAAGRAPVALEVHRSPAPRELPRLRLAARHGALRALGAKTRALADELVAAGLPAERVAVVPSAVDLRAYAGLPAPGEARARLGLPDDGPLVGYVGRLRSGRVQDKGVDVLVAAMRPVLDAVPAARLACVGGPLDAVAPLHEAAAAAGVPRERLLFRDHLPATDVPVAIAACDVLCLPLPATDFGLRWSSPMKLFEYLAAGAAVVATDAPALRDVVGDAAALLTPPGDARALGEAVVRVLRDGALAARLRAAALARAPAYTWEANARRTLALLGV